MAMDEENKAFGKVRPIYSGWWVLLKEITLVYY
jgi:hypothetical protein